MNDLEEYFKFESESYQLREKKGNGMTVEMVEKYGSKHIDGQPCYNKHRYNDGEQHLGFIISHSIIEKKTTSGGIGKFLKLKIGLFNDHPKVIKIHDEIKKGIKYYVSISYLDRKQRNGKSIAQFSEVSITKNPDRKGSGVDEPRLMVSQHSEMTSDQQQQLGEQQNHYFDENTGKNGFFVGLKNIEKEIDSTTQTIPSISPGSESSEKNSDNLTKNNTKEIQEETSIPKDISDTFSSTEKKSNMSEPTTTSASESVAPEQTPTTETVAAETKPSDNQMNVDGVSSNQQQQQQQTNSNPSEPKDSMDIDSKKENSATDTSNNKEEPSYKEMYEKLQKQVTDGRAVKIRSNLGMPDTEKSSLVETIAKDENLTKEFLQLLGKRQSLPETKSISNLDKMIGGGGIQGTPAVTAHSNDSAPPQKISGKPTETAFVYDDGSTFSRMCGGFY